MTNRTEKGDQLKNAVFDLLEATGKKNIKKEFFVGGKKSDIYFEDNGNYGEELRCAVECKNYFKRLGLSDISGIISEYMPNKSTFDVLFILHQSDITSQSEITVTLEANKWVKCVSFDVFFLLMIDFRSYLNDMKLLTRDRGLREYYVPPKTENGESLEGIIDAWIESDEAQPMAILAGYGMGKTSFAHHIVQKYAERFLNGYPCRIPIYLQLGNIVEMSSVESLICTQFSSAHPVKNFSYQKFKELNKKGQLLIVYDGFDEMKHAMSQRTFKKMFDQLNSHASLRSKILLLGRPNVFSSDDEKQLVLHGKMSSGGKDPNAPDYREIKIELFTSEQSRKFIVAYLEYMQRSAVNISDRMRGTEFLNARIDELLGDNYKTLIDRPVHARMLVELALSTEEPLNTVTRYQLYKNFIEMFLDREHQKASRSIFSPDDRRHFIQELAWFLWSNGGKRNFHISEIKKFNVSRFVTDKSEILPDTDVLREFVTGSVLERKDGDYYYFSHRSFQEYLVSSFILGKEFWAPEDLRQFAYSSNQEVLSFIEESGETKCFVSDMQSALMDFKGDLPYIFVNYISENSKAYSRELRELIEQSPWLSFFGGLNWNLEISLIKSISDSPACHDDSLRLLSFLFGFCSKDGFEDDNESLSRLVFCISLLHQMCFSCVSGLRFSGKNILGDVAVQKKECYLALRIILLTITPNFNDKNELVALNFNREELSRNIEQALKGVVGISRTLNPEEFDKEDGSNPSVVAVTLRQLSSFYNLTLASEDERNVNQVFRRFWMARPRLTNFIDVNIRSRQTMGSGGKR